MLILHPERLLAAAGLEMECIINFMQTDGLTQVCKSVRKAQMFRAVWGFRKAHARCPCKQTVKLLIFITRFFFNPGIRDCMCRTLLFNFVSYVFLLSCLCNLTVMHVLLCISCFHPANWHSSATLTEVFPCFILSCKANARVYLAKTGHGQHSSQLDC